MGNGALGNHQVSRGSSGQIQINPGLQSVCGSKNGKEDIVWNQELNACGGGATMDRIPNWVPMDDLSDTRSTEISFSQNSAQAQTPLVNHSGHVEDCSTEIRTPVAIASLKSLWAVLKVTYRMLLFLLSILLIATFVCPSLPQSNW
jgi:hypothetical protein